MTKHDRETRRAEDLKIIKRRPEVGLTTSEFAAAIGDAVRAYARLAAMRRAGLIVAEDVPRTGRGRPELRWMVSDR